MHPLEVLLTILLTPLGWLFRGRHADEPASLANAPELAATRRLTVTSPSFGDGETIPAKHCGKFIGTNVSPALRWSALPEGTKELLLVMEDLNSPGRTPRLHTVAAFAPSVGGLAEGALVAGAPGICFVPRNGGYAGPRPLPGHGPHRYRFHLYALDGQADLARVPSARELPVVLKGHVLASGTLNGTRKARVAVMLKLVALEEQRASPAFMTARESLLAGAFTMDASGPATGPALAFLQLLARSTDAALSRLLLLRVLDPADELVACQGRDVHPGSERRGACGQRVAQIFRELVHHPSGHSLADHPATLAHADEAGAQNSAWPGFNQARGTGVWIGRSKWSTSSSLPMDV